MSRTPTVDQSRRRTGTAPLRGRRVTDRGLLPRRTSRNRSVQPWITSECPSCCGRIENLVALARKTAKHEPRRFHPSRVPRFLQRHRAFHSHDPKDLTSANSFRQAPRRNPEPDLNRIRGHNRVSSCRTESFQRTSVYRMRDERLNPLDSGVVFSDSFSRGGFFLMTS